MFVAHAKTSVAVLFFSIPIYGKRQKLLHLITDSGSECEHLAVKINVRPKQNLLWNLSSFEFAAKRLSAGWMEQNHAFSGTNSIFNAALNIGRLVQRFVE